MTRGLARLFLKLAGWTPEGSRPASRRYVLIAAPHTSNWDLAFLLALARIFDIRINFMAKHTLFRWPMGWFMKRVGGIPIRRHKRENVVRQMVSTFEREGRLALVVPPEATRAYAPHWRSGFYQIAWAAKVPVVLGYLDYAKKRGGFGPEIILTGDPREDMREIRDFYEDKTGKYPESFGEIRLKEEA